MMSDTPIQTLFTEDEPSESDGESAEPQAKQKKAGIQPPNRRVRRAIRQVIARMQDDVRELAVHVICGKPYVGPTQNRCSCPVKVVQATGSVTFLATHERGKHDL
jgi:hypothetical protein